MHVAAPATCARLPCADTYSQTKHHEVARLKVCSWQQATHGSSSDASAASRPGVSGSDAADTPAWPAERVIFLNDVYFCAHDVVRLLQHKADIVCGMDFDRPKLEEAPMQARRLALRLSSMLCMACARHTVRAVQVQRSLLRAHLRSRYGLPDLLGALLSCVPPVLRHWRSQARVQEAFRVRLHVCNAVCKPCPAVPCNMRLPCCMRSMEKPGAAALRAGQRATGVLRHMGRPRHKRQPLPQAAAVCVGARRPAAHLPGAAVPRQLLLERAGRAQRCAIPPTWHAPEVRAPDPPADSVLVGWSCAREDAHVGA